MKNLWNKFKKTLLAIVCLILVLAGYGGTVLNEDGASVGESTAIVQEQEALPAASLSEPAASAAEEELPQSTQAQPETQQQNQQAQSETVVSGGTTADDKDVITGATTESEQATTATTVDVVENSEEALIDPDGTYTSAEDVALYIYTYGELPKNFMTKKEAKALGWSGGSLEEYAPGMCIGGDYFGNYEGMLPKAKGREYHECDIDTLGKSSRGAKRIVFSDDGLIYYTDDHYDSFELLYGEE